MPATGPELAGRLEAVNRRFLAAIAGLTPEQWRLRGANAPGWDFGEDEVRSLGQIARHTADHHLVQMEIVFAVAQGRLPAPAEPDGPSGPAAGELDPARVGELLERNCAAAAAMLRRLSAAQLERDLTFRGWTMTARELAEQVLIGHVEWHLASLEATLAGG